MITTYILRVWMPDRPGALGALASRIGAVGGDVAGIDILERGAGRVIDELVVELPSDDPALVELLTAEIHQVDGVDVESIRPATLTARDPRLDALETAAMLVGAPSAADAVIELCTHAVRAVGAVWGAVVDLRTDDLVTSAGDAPSTAWLAAFVAGSQSSARVADGDTGPSDVVWAPLPVAGYALVMGRHGEAFRARERRQVAALARIVDARFRDMRIIESRSAHPSTGW
jgi:hypothetical protein